MPNKFDINAKPLHKAKPCITQLLRDDGSIEWFENCRAGQLLEIKSGLQKAYQNLDSTKIQNFNILTPETEFENVKKVISSIENDRIKFASEAKINEDKLTKELSILEQQRNDNLLKDRDTSKVDKKISLIKNSYDKRIDSLITKYVKLQKNKQKNFGNASKPILGFVCYEKEFNALPYKPFYDSKQVTQWMDDILKNKKDFQAQRTEAIGKTLLWILLGIGVLAFIFFRWGAPFFEKEAEVVQPTVTTLSFLFPLIGKGGLNWLKEKKRKFLKYLYK